MKKFFLIFIPVFICAPCLQAVDLGAYQLILDKQLLGIEKVTPIEIAPTTTVVAAPSWSRDYRMTMITQDEDKLRVGLQNLKDQSAVLLIEGDNSYPDFLLVSGNYEQGSAVIRYRGSENRFMIETGPANAAVGEMRPSIDRRSRGGSPRNYQPGGTRSASPITAPTAAPPAREFKTREELQAHLEKQQMDAIRNGKPPLPIPLTRQMDDQLVNEGVLPPQP